MKCNLLYLLTIGIMRERHHKLQYRHFAKNYCVETRRGWGVTATLDNVHSMKKYGADQEM